MSTRGSLLSQASPLAATVGRPFQDRSGRRILAPLEEALQVGHWSRPEGALRPETDAIPAALREQLAREWAAAALIEHASVGAYSVLALELLVLGAPPSLVEGALRAGVDELHHARACFELASCYAGCEIGPGPMPFVALSTARSDVVEVAVSVAQGGCIEEAVGALEIDEAFRGARDGAVREALELISQDEQRHAELAWHTLAWLIDRDPDRVVPPLIEVFEQSLVQLPPDSGGGPHAEVLLAHGRLDPARRQVLARFALREVVLPRAEALLSGS